MVPLLSLYVSLIHFFSLCVCVCVSSLYPINRETGEENWDAESCQTLPSPAVSHTKCLCSKLSTFAVLAQKAKEPVSDIFTFMTSHHTSVLSSETPSRAENIRRATHECCCRMLQSVWLFSVRAEKVSMLSVPQMPD